MNLLMLQNMIYEHCLLLAKGGIERCNYPSWIARLLGVPEDKAAKRLRELRI